MKNIKSGIYIACSGLLRKGYLKIGHSGDMSKMLTRYRMYYGKNVKFIAYYTVNHIECEEILKELIKKYIVSGELYKMKYTDCKNICKNITNKKGQLIT